MIGQIISHYKILEKLGEGGMGVVYKAHDTKLDRDVALKFLPHHLTATPDEQARFLQEARAASALNHPNVCTIYDIAEYDGKQFIAMEYIDGKTLRAVVPVQKMQSAIDYAIQIGDALQEAHSKGIVHRDIKTDNIMVNSKNQIKVMDFGLAKLKGSLRLTKTSSTVGTLAYMSPEQIQGGEVDARSDIFSFGVVVYEMLSGHLPFRGEHEAAMMYSIVNEDPLPLESLRIDLPEEMKNVISKCLEKDKTKRYQNCEQIVNDLKLLQRHVEHHYSPVSNRFHRSWSWIWWILAGVLGVLLLGIAAYLYSLSFFHPSPSIPSIAVLYLENISRDKQYDEFSVGMTEELLNELANIPGLQVVSRNDVAQYREKIVDIQKVGEHLGVSYVLEGSVRLDGKRIRVTCQVIQTNDRFHFWSSAYTRDLGNVFDIQTEIAQEVAKGLKAKFAQKKAEQKLGLPENSLVK